VFTINSVEPRPGILRGEYSERTIQVQTLSGGKVHSKDYVHEPAIRRAMELLNKFVCTAMDSIQI